VHGEIGNARGGLGDHTMRAGPKHLARLARRLVRHAWVRIALAHGADGGAQARDLWQRRVQPRDAVLRGRVMRQRDARVSRWRKPARRVAGKDEMAKIIDGEGGGRARAGWDACAHDGEKR
jgi:hypothetical protein